MNRAYIRLLFCSIVFLLITTLNSFFDFLNSYTIILFLLLYLIGIYKYIGYERNTKRYQKDIIIQIFTYIIIYYMITYLSGIFIGFNRSGYNLSILSIIKHILPVLLSIPLLELIRYIFVTKGTAYKSIIVLTIISLVMADITLLINVYNYGTLQFILSVIIPSISKNILLTYVSFKVGYKPAILYRVLIELPVYILPIFPSFGIYIESLLHFLFPMLIVYIIYYNFSKAKNERIVSRKEVKTIQRIVIFIISIVLLVIIILTTGLFKYFAITIGSESMTPYINKGDIVIVEKLNSNEINDLKEKEILVFKHDNIIIVHRIIKIMEVGGKKYFYTKGDNNNSEDGYPIGTSEIVGKALTKIRYLGYPTVELSEMINKKK